VVDDDDSIRDFIAMALGDEGYEVATVHDGAAALEVMAGFRPDLILLDLRMPGMDGWEFSHAYRQAPPPRVPILVLTAARDAGASASEIDADAFLAKPFELRDLLALVERLVRDRRG